MRKEFIWYLNGKFVKSNEAKISLDDLGLVRGWGLFEYLRTYHGRPFKLKEHLQRFYRSAKKVYLKPPLTEDALARLVKKLLRLNGSKKLGIRNKELGIKIILTAGPSRDGVTPSGKPTLAVQVFPVMKYPPRLYRRGISLLAYESHRFLADVKSLDYLAAMVALEEAKVGGFADALFIGPAGEVFEATRSNFFAFFGDTLATAKEGILPGITRRLVLDLARRRFPTKEKRFFLKDLKRAKETFITSSDKEIMPVVRVGNLRIGNGRVGERTRWLMKEFKKYYEY